LKAVRDLVAGVTGFSQERGDQITVESLPFETTLQQTEPEPQQPGAGKPFNWKNWKEILHSPMALAALGGGTFVLIVLGAGVLVFLKRRKKAPEAGSVANTAPAALKSSDPMKVLEDAKAKAALSSANMAEQMEAALAERIAEQEKADLATLASLKMPTVTTKKSELLSKELRDSTKKDPSISAHVLQTWLHDN
jgi:flagellar M-ring protein FliF